MTCGFLVGSRNFIGLFWVSCEAFVLHGKDCNHWVAKSCATTVYRWLLRDSLSSLGTLWSAVIKSPKLSALDTTALARLLQEALVIFVFKHISQFGSFGKCVNTLCLHEPGSTYARGSIGSSWDELEVSWLPCSDFPKSVLKYFHQPNAPWILVADEAIHAIYLFVPLSIPYFYFAFRFLWIHATGLPEALHSYSQLLSDTGVSTSLFSDTESPLADVDSCDEDGDEADEDVVEEELADIPGNIKWYSVWYIAINSLAIFDEMWILTAFLVIRVATFFAEFPQWKHCKSFLKKHDNDEQVQFFDIYIYIYIYRRFFMSSSSPTQQR